MFNLLANLDTEIGWPPTADSIPVRGAPRNLALEEFTCSLGAARAA
jgi:hypothetical protein